MSLLPDLQLQKVRKRKKYFLIPDGKSDKKYCPEGLAGMYKGILYLPQSNREIVFINPLLYTGIIPLILISFSQFTLANHPYQMSNKCLEALPTLPHTQVHHSLSWLFPSNNISQFFLLLVSAFTFFTSYITQRCFSLKIIHHSC